MMKILASAQAFGYGPASKLVTLSKSIKKDTHNISVDFIGEDIALTYAQNNPEGFSHIFKFDINQLPDISEYEIIISVMCPEIAVWGFLHKKKVIYIDSLYWFWNWRNKNFDSVNSIIEKLSKSSNPSDAMNLLNGVEPHHLQYIGHRVSNKSIVQVFSNEEQKTNVDLYRKKINPVKVGPIIDLSKRNPSAQRNKVIISLSGLMSPLNRKEYCLIYAGLVLNILEDLIDQIPENIEIIFTTNPELVAGLRQYSERIKFVSLNNAELLNMLNEAIVMIAPAGITTVYESLNYDVPIIFLPEQHDGHYKNFLRLGAGKIDEPNLRKIFPELLFSTRIEKSIKDIPDDEIIAIQNIIRNKYDKKDDPIIIDMKNLILKTWNELKNVENRTSLLNKQKNLLLSNTPQFNEADFIETIYKI